MKGAEIPGRSRNIWSKEKYQEKVGIYGLSRNTEKMPRIPGRSSGTLKKKECLTKITKH
jgi:hypothetical protein